MSAIVDVALFCTIFELFDVEKIVTLKCRLGTLKIDGNGNGAIR